MKRFIPILALIGSVSFASSNFLGSDATNTQPANEAVSPTVSVVTKSQAEDAATLATIGDPKPAFEANAQALVFGTAGAMALLLTIVTRRGHGNHAQSA